MRYTAFRDALVMMFILGMPLLAAAQGADTTTTSSGQSRESAAVDPTAAQWSFQFAAEYIGDYRKDEIAPGIERPEGGQGFYQFRLIAPLPKDEKFPITLLPRLTLRYQQNAAGDYGIGGSDLFILGIAGQWATGRWGLGPQFNFPSQVGGFGNPNWGFGLAAAVTQRAAHDKIFLSLLFQQTWSENAEGETKPSTLGINPGIVYQLGGSWYVGNGDFVIAYDWESGGVLFPIRGRLGKMWVRPSNTINAYVEAGTSTPSADWLGPAAQTSVRVNIQWQIPVSL